jgi:hypothetical protein
MDLQAKSPAGRAPVRSDTEPVSQPASPAFGNSQPGAVALRQLFDTMHDGPRMAVQRALTEAMQDNPRMIVQRMFAGTAQLMNGKEEESEEEEEEEEALPDTISFYHGTDLETAKAGLHPVLLTPA